MVTEWEAGYAIEFSDGGDPDVAVVSRGSREDCERVLRLMSGVMYRGSRPNPRAHSFTRPAPDAAKGGGR